MGNISSNEKSFKQLSFSITALPLLPYMKLDGFAPEGVQWDDAELASVTMGADGQVAVNTKPVLYSGSFSLLPNSNCRNALDMLINIATPTFGRVLAGYSLTMTVVNNLTGMKAIYSGGVITSANSGDTANLEEGQANKTYKFTFSSRDLVP